MVCMDLFVGDDNAWSPFVPTDTLAITATKNDGDYATTGYRNIHRVWGLKLNVEDMRVKSTAHELGHVMGLNHEMKRADRDTFLLYQCTKLNGFEAALKDCQADHPSVTAQEFCNSVEWAYRYESPHAEYIMEPMIVGNGSLRLQ